MNRRTMLSVREITIFAMLGALMFAGKKIMEGIPNVHPLTMLTMVYALVYRKKGIIPVVIYLILDTLATGGITWIVPYYYIFPLCWLVTLALPQKLPNWTKQVMYSAVCALFGLLFGTLYAPWHALLEGLNFEKTLAWIAAGLLWDISHAGGNLAASFLILPMVALLKKAGHFTTRRI